MIKQTPLFIAWLKKIMGIQSPSACVTGYQYEYDYLKNNKNRKEHSSS